MKKFTGLTIEQYLEALSSDEAVPGGGSVSANVASYAMGLTQMVGRIALKRKKKKDAFQIIDLDPHVYQEVMSSWGDDAKQEDALQNSFRLQADLTCLIVMANEWNTHIAHLVKGSIRNDLLVSAALLEGAFKGAYHTAMINVKYMKDSEKKETAEKALEELKVKFHQKEPVSAN